ncbi:MAG: hypothetical protein H9535_15675 [Ignavibacteria bacterium]|nr:hypothetical protein [Ignavibacteria bacterium]MBL7992614.1 hypothetical protein [Candidatus Kapabacteria bacterium]
MMDSQLTMFTVEELGSIYMVPFWVFYQVAGADSVFDEQETEAFQSMLDTAPKLRDGFARAIFSNMNASFIDILHKAKNNPSRAYEGLREAMAVLDKLPPDITSEFKTLVFVMGWSVAAASGDFSDTGEGSNISEDEIDNLVQVAEVLGLSFPKLQKVIVSSDGDKVWSSFLGN